MQATLDKLVLSPPQQQCEESESPHLLIRGVPGSGKTLVLLRRAMRLARQGQKVQVFTYNRALQQHALALLALAGETRVAVTTFDSWALQQYQALKGQRRPLSGQEQLRLVQEALDLVQQQAGTTPELARFGGSALFARPLAFWKDELEWIRGQGIAGDAKPAYLAVERVGRGSALSRDLRELVWAVFKEHTSLLNLRGRIDFQGVALFLLLRKEKLPPFQHVLVDEAQDFTLARLKLLAALSRTLTLAADEHQRIYRTAFRWKDLGIDLVGGRRSRHLPKTQRSTRQILTLAATLRSGPEAELADEGTWDSAVEGPTPLWHQAASLKDEGRVLSALVKAMLSESPESSIGVLARTHELLSLAGQALDQAKLPYRSIRDEGAGKLTCPGVSLCSFHASKGLEFDHVLLFHLEEQVVPAPPPQGLEGEDAEEHLALERRLLFVALSRARHTLQLLCGPDPSRFIRDLTPPLLEAVPARDSSAA